MRAVDTIDERIAFVHLLKSFGEHDVSMAKSKHRSAFLALVLTFALSFGATTSHAQVCPFDDGNSTLAVEGLILTRYALGITGAPLVFGTGVNAVDVPSVEAAIACPSCGLNITGNPTMTVADATIISRKLAGFSGAHLTDGLALGTGTRNTPSAVQSFLLAGCGATGGTVTSITAGSGLTGGTITSSGTVAVNTSVIQNRVSGTCAVGSSIRAIAADGTVTCQTDTTGGAGTVTNVGSGVGLNGGPVTAAGTLSIAPSYRLPQTCATGQFTRFDNTSNLWECVTPVVVTSVATGPGLTGGPITSTGTVGLAQTQLLPTTACAPNELAKWTGSAWACATAASGGGSVTSVATGPGLTGGPITTAGTVNLTATQLLPTTACTTDQIIKWNGAAWACASSLLTLPTACLPGQFVTIATTGGIRCASLPSTLSVGYTATAALNAVNGVAATVALDGLPVIAFVSDTKTLIVLKCGNAPCNSGNTVTVADASGFVGPASLAIAMPSDGNPVISYAHEASVVSSSLRVLKCGNSLCSSGNVITTVDNTVAEVGRKSAIAISPVDGLAVISYYSKTEQQLKVAKCGNAACNAANTLTLVGSALGVGDAVSSIAVRASGNPLITFEYAPSTGWAILSCGNPQCSSGNSLPSFDPVPSAGASVILIPPDSLPVIVYGVFSTFAQLKVAKCGDADCSSGTTFTTVDTSLLTNGAVVRMGLSTDGFPVLNYKRSSVGEAAKLRILKCGDASCASNNISTVVAAALDYQTVGAFAVPADGLPVVVYADTASSPDRIRILKCSDAGCGNP